MPTHHQLAKPRAGLSLLETTSFVSLLCSYRPPRYNSDDVPRLELENNLELASSECSSNQLVAITVSFVPVDFEVGEETFHGLLESDVMSAELVLLKIVFEVGGGKLMPIDHSRILSTCALATDKLLQGSEPPLLTPAARTPRRPGSPTLQFYQFRCAPSRPAAASAAACA